MLAGAERAPLDLRDDGRRSGDVGVADHPRAELRPDDAAVAELGSAGKAAGAVEEREPRRGSAAARRAVDLAVGEHGDVALREGILSLLLPEDDAVDVAQLGLERVDELVLGLERAA